MNIFRSHKNTYLLVLFFMAFMPKSIAQQNIEAQFKNGPDALNKFLDKKFAQEAKKYDLNVCLISVVFAKFTIDSAGNVNHIVFSSAKGTPQVFKTILTSAIRATSGLWIPSMVNGKLKQSKPFILPLIYAMEAGCNSQDVQLNSTYKPVPNGLETNLLFMLDFEDDAGINTPQLDCVILKPIYKFSQN